MNEEWFSITDAARLLSAAGDLVDRSSLSRYLKRYPEALPLKSYGICNLVEFNALVAHRRANGRLRNALGSDAPCQKNSLDVIDARRKIRTACDGVVTALMAFQRAVDEALASDADPEIVATPDESRADCRGTR